LSGVKDIVRQSTVNLMIIHTRVKREEEAREGHRRGKYIVALKTYKQ